MEETKSCWNCNRIIMGKSKFGLCPCCTNTIGNWALAGMGGIVTGCFIMIRSARKGEESDKNNKKRTHR